MANPGTILPAPEPVIAHHLEGLRAPISEWLEKRRIPPVLLFTGRSGIGKRTMAYFLAQWIFCEKTGFREGANTSEGRELSLFGESPSAQPAHGSLRPCGECVQCQRALKGSWVDFTEIRAEGSGADEEEKSGKSESLKIDQFRKIKESLGFGSHEGGYRIFLVADADRMTAQAANSVLKILEEPPKDWIFLLTASDPTLVLPTVLSRCQTIKLRPFTPETLRALLSASGIMGEKQKLAATLAGGSWGRALAIASDEGALKRQALFDFLERPQGVLGALVDWAAQGDAAFGLLCDQLELLCLDLIRWSVAETGSAYEWANFDGARALSNHVDRVLRLKGTREAAREFWVARSERIAKARKQALTPVNRKLLIQDILVPWLEVAG